MKHKIFGISLFILTAAIVGFFPVLNKSADANIILAKHPRIQLAILLDTSSSMSGLINQTRDQLWQVVNEFSRAKQNGRIPKLEVAVYEYGNNRLSEKTGYIRQVTALTGELDQVSEALFSLTTNGGNEYCGYVIKTAVNDLSWSTSDGDIKAIFIAGNEPFSQGPVAYRDAITFAKNRGITVNTIHAGNLQQGANTGWKDGALLAGGEYMSIQHNHKIAHYNAPQDKHIVELNEKLNKTYVPYGVKGNEKAKRQLIQDQKSKNISQGLMAKRTLSKATVMYDNSKWDLVDAMAGGSVNLEKLENEALPEEMRTMSKTRQKDFMQQKIKERKEIKKQINELSRERNKYVAEKRIAAAVPGVATMNEALTSAIRKQGESKKYVFETK